MFKFNNNNNNNNKIEIIKGNQYRLHFNYNDPMIHIKIFLINK